MKELNIREMHQWQEKMEIKNTIKIKNTITIKIP